MRWSTDQKVELMRLAESGLAATAIAQMIRRKVGSVHKKYYELGGVSWHRPTEGLSFGQLLRAQRLEAERLRAKLGDGVPTEHWEIV